MRPLFVGLTGGLASGKSTVAGWLADAGFLVIDADRLVAELYAPEEAGTRAIRRIAGTSVLDERGGVDHAALASRVFAEPEIRRRVERAIHPLVRERFAQRVAESAAPIAVLEATLLVEAGYRPDFDLIVSVESSPERQLERAIARGMDAGGATARLAAQGPGTDRRAAADVIVENDGTLDDLRSATDRLIESLEAAQRRRAQ